MDRICVRLILEDFKFTALWGLKLLYFFQGFSDLLHRGKKFIDQFTAVEKNFTGSFIAVS